MKLVKKFAIATTSAVIGITGVGASSAAQAVQLFGFQYSFPSDEPNSTVISASGILTTTDLDPIKNNYTITGISGTRKGQGITETIIGLLSPGTYGINDNLLNASTPLLTQNGFSYLVSGSGEDGNGNVNVFYSSFNEGYSELSSDVDYGSFSVVPRPVPEPYTVTGSLVALSFGWWTKRKQALASQKKPHKNIYLLDS
ncbi:PEP-CTERM sorting domain-containing protein [Nostoc sp. 'Peltigera membranacea cyanobiont' 210A]|uniref:PEP-CTERM sorting domain-containing protein n=1 Tax=Nostoc sp. 'Peltigera membranacea cyanobiont' 210A TaxID=2014529 RepID=UPI000B957A10|nr:PEP-CTERM sorting domain-containing protein [Nostoc sp. 'Peltigera membranacea cyanobiont' 210A]OYD95630.1 PEP-CTERM sorting domain-containing protein [Nostoc sp. 'Peltigera membranacea cyanobiont' 210A]